MITSRRSRSWAVAAAFLLLAGVLVSASAATASTRAFSPIAKGDIIASLANGQVNEYTPTGSFVQTLIPSASTPTGSAFDSAGNLYVTEFGANDILKVDANTGAVSVFSNDTILGDGTTFNSPESIAFGPGFKYMYVSDANRNGTGGGIHVIDPATGKGVAFFALPSSAGSDGQGESDWLGFDRSGNLFMTNESPAQGVMQVDLTSGDVIQPSFAANLPDIGYAMSFDANGNMWLSDTSSILEYDSSGNLVTTITNPSFSTVFAAVFNPSYNTVYAGDLDTGNVYVYDLSGQLKRTFSVGSGVDGLSVAGTSVTPVSGYVAMGDSYSSGESLSPYLPGTDTKTDKCHRSSQAYGPLLDAAVSGLGPLSFVACSGSVTQDFFANNHTDASEPPQIKALNANTGTVTFTIGGNDVGFVPVFEKCVHVRIIKSGGYGCSNDKKFVEQVNDRIGALDGKGKASSPENTIIIPIQTLLKRIHQKAPRAMIFVAGYPHLFGSSKSNYTADKSAPSKYVCHVGLGASIDYADAQWMNSRASALDDAIKSAVATAQVNGIPVTYVNGVSADFATHGLCDSSTPWINHLYHDGLSVSPGSLHPTATGQSSGYEAAFAKLPNI